LAGDEIPLSARIMALADAYDALTSRRVYKEAYSHDTSKSMIRAEAGTHFDPAMVDAFLVHEQQFITTRQQFAETNDNVVPKEEPKAPLAVTG
jgi:putative two-component system response regulator